MTYLLPPFHSTPSTPCMKENKKKFSVTGFTTKDGLYLTFPPFLLLFFVVALVIFMVSVCIRFTKGPLSTTALLEHLRRLQAKFVSKAPINPETERAEIEILQNKIKTSSAPAIISGNADLERLFRSNCLAVQSVLLQSGLKERVAWIKLNALLADFTAVYFAKSS